MEKVLFKEEQRFKQWWMWLIIAFALLAAIIPLLNAILEEQSQLGSSNTARLTLYGILMVLFASVVLITMLFIKLKTRITDKGIYMAYLPFARKWKKYTIADIEKYELRSYRAVLEFGGYGMKKRRKAGQAFTISGNMGLQLYLKNGKKVLIGTQKKQAMEYAMLKLMGEGKQFASAEKMQQETKSPFNRKVKKFLIILAIEIVVIIVIFSLMQIFN